MMFLWVGFMLLAVGLLYVTLSESLIEEPKVDIKETTDRLKAIKEKLKERHKESR